jgi:acetate kinase
VKRVLVLNAGSSSLKWVMLEAATERVCDQGEVTWESLANDVRDAEIRATLERAGQFDAVGHRVVHGGLRFREAVVVDAAVRAGILELAELAPLHNPAALAGIDVVTEMFPRTPQVAAFDTAFHASIPEVAATYPLPWEWSEQWGLRRLGFHGLSVQYAVRRAKDLLGQLPARLVVCHLGAGCSVTAVADGRSVDTSMGFTPLEGLMMARRAGSVDPGLLLYLLGRKGVSVAEMDTALNQRSGLLGVSGVSVDLREILSAAARSHRRAQLAISMFVHSVVATVGAMVAVLGGLDTVVFTGGIGEHSSLIREQVTGAFGYLGARLDASANAIASSDADVATQDSAVRVLRVTAREDLAVLAEVKRLLLKPAPEDP